MVTVFSQMYKRTRSRKFVIDGEELVRHTEDLISIRDESKTTYAQRVYKLRYFPSWVWVGNYKLVVGEARGIRVL